MKNLVASVVIPTYNREKLLRTTLLSLSKQNYPKSKYEIIVVDDGNDATDKMIKSLKISNLRYFKIKKLAHRCVSRARNFGIKKARGEIIVFLDSDIVATPNFISEHVISHGKNKNLVVIGYASALETKAKHEMKKVIDLVDKEYKKIVDIPIIPSYRDAIYEECSENLNDFERPWETLLTGNASIRRQHLLEVGMFDENFKGWGLEDIELGYRLFKKGLEFKLNRKALGYHIGTDKILNPFLNSSNDDWKNYTKNMSYFLIKFDNKEVKRTLINADKKIPDKFKLFKHEEEIEKRIRLNNQKIAALAEKQKSILKRSGILEEWNEIEKYIKKLEKESYDAWEKVEPLEMRRWEIEREKIELLKRSGILEEWNEIEREKDEMEKIFDEKLKTAREPKRVELGEMLEKEYLVTKGKLKESLQVLKPKIQKCEKELMTIWIKNFESIEREIARLIGKESLLLKSKGIYNAWKKLDEKSHSISKEMKAIDDQIKKAKEKRSLLLKRHNISKTMSRLEKESNKIKSSIYKEVDLIKEKIYGLKIKQNSLIEKGGVLKEWNRIEKEKRKLENENFLLNFELKKLELNRQIICS